MSLAQIQAMLAALSEDDRRALLRMLREEYRVALHPMETIWNTTAEAILEAIHASPDLTQRGVRGVLAEATFRTTVVPTQLQGWESIPFAGDQPYDLILRNGEDNVTVQVKNQRREAGAPKIDARLTRATGSEVFVVETQRTRNGAGVDADGAAMATRPYRFGEFDVLAVCLQPATGRWTEFIYCPGHRLLPRPDQPTLLKVMQPVYVAGGHGWTSNFDVAAQEVQSKRNSG